MLPANSNAQLSKNKWQIKPCVGQTWYCSFVKKVPAHVQCWSEAGPLAHPSFTIALGGFQFLCAESTD
jgi:hypothetical protein